MKSKLRQELLDLLEALCEERLSPEQHARLDRLVVENGEARKLYVDYVALHGILSWDVAAAASGEMSVLRDEAVPKPATRRIVRPATIAASLAAVLLIGWSLLLLRPGADQDAPAAAVATNSDESDGSDTAPAAAAPIVLPGRDRRSDEPSISSAVAGSPLDDEQIDVPFAQDFDPVVAIHDAVASRWESVGVQPAPSAEDAEWVRRVYLDLAGRIPSATEAGEFLDDPADDKRAALIDELLDSPEFARNFATAWTNLLIGRSENRRLDRGNLHAYLRGQFAQNRPWSETVTALITAEGSAKESGPANFLLAHLNNEAVPATAVTARCFLGLQVQCTQCHAHPFYREWGQEQFWELNSFFQQTAVERKAAEDGSGMEFVLTNRPVGGPTYYENRAGEMKVAFPKFAETEVDPDKATNRRRELARLIVAGDDPQLARAFVNRTWAHFFGYGFVNPVDDMGPHNAASHPELLQALANHFVAGDYDVRALCRAICNSAPYQLASRPGDSETNDDPQYGDPPLFSRMYLKPLSAEQLYDSIQVATLADEFPARAIESSAKARHEWIGQFFADENTEENCESSTFGGTLPQALTMMNGDLVTQAVSGAEQTRLSAILAATPDESERIRQIMLATLSRYPTRDELNGIREFLRKSVRQQVQSGRVPNARAAVEESLKDVYWACLNSTEFIVNH